MATENIASGTYTGNGTSQSITIGWQPKFIIINNQSSGEASCYKTDGMAGDDFIQYASNAEIHTTFGVTITSTGFSVGSRADINGSGDPLSWIAIR